MVFLYGSLFWGLFPIEQSISWEGHLGGALTGFLLALLYRKEEPVEEVREHEPEWEEDFEEDEAYWEENEEKKDDNANNITITYHYKPKEKDGK